MPFFPPVLTFCRRLIIRRGYADMLGHWEIIAIIVIALLIFGPKKIPELMKGIGRGLREFKNSMKDDSDDEDTSKKQPYDDDRK